MTGRTGRPRTLGVVASEMENQPTGVGRYVEELLLALRDMPEAGGWTVQLYFRGAPFEHPLWSDEAPVGASCTPLFDCRGRIRPILWEQLRLPGIVRRQAPDLLFSPGYSLPGRPTCPSVVTIHDLSFELLPRDFGWRERWRRRLLARVAARRATRVLTDTARTAGEIERRYGVAADRIGVVPLGVAPRFERAGLLRREGAAELEPDLATLGVRRPYLLVLGAALPRRRLDLVLAGLGGLLPDRSDGAPPRRGDVADPDLQLVIAGPDVSSGRRDLDRLIAESDCADRVRRLGYVDDALLPDLVAGAEGTVYLSEYEGYGLPPLESLAAGVPALVADAPALFEVWPDYPLRAERLDADAVTDGLRRLLFDEPSCREAAREGPARMRKLTWASAARRFLREATLALHTAGSAGA